MRPDSLSASSSFCIRCAKLHNLWGLTYSTAAALSSAVIPGVFFFLTAEFIIVELLKPTVQMQWYLETDANPFLLITSPDSDSEGKKS